LTDAVSVGDLQLIGGVTLRIGLGKVGHNQLDCSPLAEGTYPRLVGSLHRCSSIDRLDRSCEVHYKIDQQQAVRSGSWHPTSVLACPADRKPRADLILIRDDRPPALRAATEVGRSAGLFAINRDGP